MSDSSQDPKVSRRRLLKQGSAIASSLVATKALSWPLRKTPKIHAPEEREVVVIGSGFGGAITALRLVEAGVPVTIIEQGRRWDQPLAAGKQRFSKNLYPDGRSTWLSSTTVVPLGPPLPIWKTTGVLQGRKLAGKTVLNGAAWGGGSISWGGVMVKPDKELFAQVFPAEISYEELEPHFAALGERFQRSTIPEDVLAAEPYRHVRVGLAHNEKAGIESVLIHTSTDWDIVRAELRGEIPASLIAGEAIYGNNSGAKVGMDRSYLKDAEATGLLEVRCLHHVDEIEAIATGGFIVRLKELSIDGEVIGLRTISCKKLFLTAGSVSSSSLLVKAKATGKMPLLNAEVGQGWGNNGNAYALRLGIPESTGTGQAGPPSLGLNQLNHPITPLFIEHPQLPLPLNIHGLMYFSIGITPTRGSFRYVPEQNEVVIDWPEHDAGQAQVNAALLDVLKRLNNTNGGLTTTLLTSLQSKVKDDICYHPLGGMVIGKATDFWGRVHGYDGLYVNDSSLMPGASACCNPSMTISALAERNIRMVIAEDFPDRSLDAY